MDVAAASKDDNSIAWFENDGAQSFTKRVVDASAGAARRASLARRFRAIGDGPS
jgi:hypothetical protein